MAVSGVPVVREGSGCWSRPAGCDRGTDECGHGTNRPPARQRLPRTPSGGMPVSRPEAWLRLDHGQPDLSLTDSTTVPAQSKRKTRCILHPDRQLITPRGDTKLGWRWPKLKKSRPRTLARTAPICSPTSAPVTTGSRWILPMRTSPPTCSWWSPSPPRRSRRAMTACWRTSRSDPASQSPSTRPSPLLARPLSSR